MLQYHLDREGGGGPGIRDHRQRLPIRDRVPHLFRRGGPGWGGRCRHRLSRGGDRAANSALHRIALVRMANHPPTRAYVARQTANARSKREIIRLLKRAIAREIYRLLTHPAGVPNYADLRTVRQATNITVTIATRHFDVWPAVISRLERGLRRDDDLAQQYRTWLAAA
jgi:transposase